ncbi:MAG TPA: hypothetical protein VF389_11670 [Woeseiaceae bacterium]
MNEIKYREEVVAQLTAMAAALEKIADSGATAFSGGGPRPPSPPPTGPD